MPLTFERVSAAFNFNQFEVHIMPETRLKTNKNKVSIPLDAEHRCNLCKHRSEQSLTIPIEFKLSVRRHSCGLVKPAQSIPFNGAVKSCRMFSCQHGDGMMTCERGPNDCVCAGVVA